MSKRGKPLLADNSSNQCEALTLLTEWKKRCHINDLRCPFQVKLSVGKKRLCYRHALLESLAILIHDGQAKILPQPQRPRYSAVQTIKDKP